VKRFDTGSRRGLARAEIIEESRRGFDAFLRTGWSRNCICRKQNEAQQNAQRSEKAAEVVCQFRSRHAPDRGVTKTAIFELWQRCDNRRLVSQMERQPTS
jgi:hypothetical protein